MGLPSKEEALEFCVHRNVTFLFKDFLRIIEEIGEDHDISLDNLKNHLPAQYEEKVDLSNPMTDAKKALIRKRVLDLGNEIKRTLSREIKEINTNFP
jgi:hypothetical protein